MAAVRSIVTGIKNYSEKDGNKNIVLLAVYLMIQTGVFAMLTPFFITAANFQNLMRQTAELGMVTIPQMCIRDSLKPYLPKRKYCSKMFE